MVVGKGWNLSSKNKIFNKIFNIKIKEWKSYIPLVAIDHVQRVSRRKVWNLCLNHTFTMYTLNN